MKKTILLIASSLFLFSCDAIEDVINNNIPPVEQTIEEDFTIDATELAVEGPISDSITIDTSLINEEIDNASDSENIGISEITLDDLEIKIAEGSAIENFDFLDSLVLNIYTDDPANAIEIDFGTIAKGLDTLSLPDGASTNILSLIEGSNVGDLTIDFDLVTNTALEEDLQLELISTLLAQLEIEL